MSVSGPTNRTLGVLARVEALGGDPARLAELGVTRMKRAHANKRGLRGAASAGSAKVANEQTAGYKSAVRCGRCGEGLEHAAHLHAYVGEKSCDIDSLYSESTFHEGGCVVCGMPREHRVHELFQGKVPGSHHYVFTAQSPRFAQAPAAGDACSSIITSSGGGGGRGGGGGGVPRGGRGGGGLGGGDGRRGEQSPTGGVLVVEDVGAWRVWRGQYAASRALAI